MLFDSVHSTHAGRESEVIPEKREGTNFTWTKIKYQYKNQNFVKFFKVC
jgi:hypothetical protein